MRICVIGLCLIMAGCAGALRHGGEPEAPPSGDSAYDLVIRNGAIYDGTGSKPFNGDVAVKADTIAAIGSLPEGVAEREIDATGLAVAPGFVNMLSWAASSLARDGRSMSDVKQGVTLEVFGEGHSLGPLSDAMKRQRAGEDDDRMPEWTTLGEGLEHLVDCGISTNVASFVGATTVRIHELGYDDRDPTPDELEKMQDLVRRAMEEGAVGVGSSLIYVPASFAETPELVALARAAAEYDGLYVSHIRNEGDRLVEAVEEIFTIAREAGVRAEIYHLKASGPDNWPKMDVVIEMIESARTSGLAVTADMYTYPASSTGLHVAIPDWAQEGGHSALIERLHDASTRERILGELALRSPDKTLLVNFRNDSLRGLIGNTLAEVAELRGKTPGETLLDLIVEDDSRVGAVYFTMSEENLRKQIRLPWVSFGSDGGSFAAEGDVLKNGTHPRAYGNFARLLGKYVRDERLITLEEAIRRLTSLPATNLRLSRRGQLRPGYLADVVVFDPATIRDHATFEQPHQYASGMVHVFVNGVQVLHEGEHTGAKPGRFVRGPGWTGW